MDPIVKLPLIDKMEFIDDVLLRRAAPILPRIQKKDIRPLAEMYSQELQQGKCGFLTTEGAALRQLLCLLRREADPRDREGIFEYLQSLKMNTDACEELADVLCQANFYSSVPNSLTLRPTLVSLQWKIDLSLCQRYPEELQGPTQYSSLLQRSRVLLLLRRADGSSYAMATTVKGLAALRLAVTEAIQAAKNVQRRLQACDDEISTRTQ